MIARALFVSGALVLSGAACGQTVSMTGSLGTNKAVLVIDGSLRTVAVGSTVQGVRLISTGPQQSVVEVGGKRVVLQLGAAQVSLGERGGESGADKIVLTAGSGGHFTASGAINGGAMQFLVDTGATTIAMGRSDAERIGLKYKEVGRPGRASTANGIVEVYNVRLAVVRVGDVQVHDVEATVMPMNMPHVLLGNSFLTRFQMTRFNDVMTLQRRL